MQKKKGILYKTSRTDWEGEQRNGLGAQARLTGVDPPIIMTYRDYFFGSKKRSKGEGNVQTLQDGGMNNGLQAVFEMVPSLPCSRCPPPTCGTVSFGG